MCFFFFSSRRRHTRLQGDWSSDVCSSDLFPIVHLTGTSTINGVQGQGILLVDGDLNIQGGFQWFGVTIIKGSLKDRKSTRLNSSHLVISYAVFCLKKKKHRHTVCHTHDIV